MISPEKIKTQARELGFDLVGFTTSQPVSESHIDRLRKWLQQGCAGQMHYMHRNFKKRIAPDQLLPRAQSVICVGLNYRPDNQTNASPVANYALYEDYHKFVKDRLYMLAAWIKDNLPPHNRFKFKVCVDSVPLAERALAERAGLGFIGKNSMLINPHLGSQILLGELVSTLELPPDSPAENKCSDCDRCIRACPTGALQTDGTCNSSRCISYLTIEHNDAIPAELADKMDQSLFGCDRCILACPFEKEAPTRKNADFRCIPALKNLTASEVLKWNQADFDHNCAGSTLQRTGLQNIQRNARICLKNQRDK